MDLMFELELLGADLREVGTAISHAVSTDRARAWPITYSPGREERRSFGRTKFYPAELWIPTTHNNRPIGAAHARPDDTYVALDPELAPLLVRTLRIVAAHHRGGFTFRATWPGSPVEQTLPLTIDGLADQILAGHLSEFHRYRVGPLTPSAPGL